MQAVVRCVATRGDYCSELGWTLPHRINRFQTALGSERLQIHPPV